MTFDLTNGNVGIGTTSPSTKLEVDGTSTFTDIVVSDTGSTGGSIDLTGELTINAPGLYAGTSVLKVNNTSYFNANVGIGIDNASNPLHIYEATGSGSIDNATTGALVLEHGDTDGHSRILFKCKNDTSDFGAIQYDSGTGTGGISNSILRIIAGNDAGNNDSIRFRTDETDRMTIAGGGNVGIGTTTPDSRLHIYEPTGSGNLTSATSGALILEHGNTNGSSRILFKSANNSNSDFGAVHYRSGDSGNEKSALYLIAGNDAGSTNKDSVRLRTDERDGFMLDGNGRVVMGIVDANLEIKRSGESMLMQTFIDNNAWNDNDSFPGDNDRYKLVMQDRHGMVLMGSTTKGNRNGVLHIISQQEAPRQDGMSFVASNNTNNIINFENTARGSRGQIKGNGSGSVLYQTSSDRRLKTNIENMDSQLNNIMNLQPRKFKWIEDDLSGHGFIAQEVHNIYPEFRDNYNETYCSDNPNYDPDCPCDGSGNMYYYGLDYGNFTPYIVKAFQEYKTQTDAVIANLEARLSALENN